MAITAATACLGVLDWMILSLPLGIFIGKRLKAAREAGEYDAPEARPVVLPQDARRFVTEEDVVKYSEEFCREERRALLRFMLATVAVGLVLLVLLLKGL